MANELEAAGALDPGAVADLLKEVFPQLGTEDDMNGGDAVEALAELYRTLRANDGIGTREEAVETVRALLGEEGAADERWRELLRANDGFCDMVVREAEATIIHASIDELVEFAYGDWDEARAAWKRLQRARYSRRRHAGVNATQ